MAALRVILLGCWLTLVGGGAPAVPLIDGLGTHRWVSASTNPEAQAYWEQGQAFLAAFNHGAAEASFQEAVRLDPSCGLALWGIAQTNAPHPNEMHVSRARWQRGKQALQQALALPRLHPAWLESLLAASDLRLGAGPEDTDTRHAAFAETLGQLWQQHPQEVDLGAWYGEALLVAAPWDQWSAEGQPQGGTLEILAVLEKVIQQAPDHPLAHHLLIHALEASPTPERALASAERLPHLQPNAAHAVHMASHIFSRVGKWEETVRCNELAVEATTRLVPHFGPRGGALPLYSGHDRHYLVYGALMTGQRDVALRAAQALVEEMEAPGVAGLLGSNDFRFLMPLEVHMRFGEWEAILSAPAFPRFLPLAETGRRALRAMALAALGRPQEARQEQTAFEGRRKTIEEGEGNIGSLDAAEVLAAVSALVEGEILLSEEKGALALAALRHAVALQDEFPYDEPPTWPIPMRHPLGAALLAQGQYAEAEKVYREDLRQHPENGWSLFGLQEALLLQRRPEEAQAVAVRFERAWAHATVAIPSSCFCVPGPTAPRLETP